MRLTLLVPLLLFCGALNAYQSLQGGSFLYNNLTVGSNSSIMAGVDTSVPLQMIVLKTSSFNSWVNGGRSNPLFDKTVDSGLYEVNLSAGRYTVIFVAQSKAEATADAVAVPRGSGWIANVSGTYVYNISLQRYGAVNISLLSNRDFRAFPISVSIGSYLTYLSSDNNFDSIYNIYLEGGSYALKITSNTPTQIFMQVKTSNSVINPLAGFNSSESWPVGVVSYGVYNNSGKLEPYQVSTSEIVGEANITMLRATDGNSSSDNNSAAGASLQMNVEMNTQLGGMHKVFWLQNVVDFNTTQQSYYLVNNIWNNTLPDANMTGTEVFGSGNISVCGPCGNQRFYAYTYPYDYFNYTLPFNIELVTVENQTANGTLVSFGYQILQSGSDGVLPLTFYDRVLFPGYSNSSMLISPYVFTPSVGNLSGNYYDAELVFGGESGGSQSYFSRLASVMWIYYYANGTLAPFPSVYTFGQDTAETAANVRVMPSSYGMGAFATTGRLDPFEQVLAGAGLNKTVLQIQNSSGSVAAPTTTMQYGGGRGVVGLGNYSVPIAMVLEYSSAALLVMAVLMLVRIILRR